MVNVVLAGGGSAGHTSPLIATAHALRERDPEGNLHCVGTARGLETRVIPDAGLALSLIPPVPMPRRLTPQLLAVPWRLGVAVARAGRILEEQRADVAVGFGGYVALPVYLAALLRRVPIVIHEQNAVPGLANRVAARFTRVVAVTFAGTPLPHGEVVGLPVRQAITTLDRDAERSAACRELGLRPDLPVLLVSGGSQGARSINSAVAGAVGDLLAAGIQVVHVLGPKNLTADIGPKVDADTGAGYHPLAYVDRMERAYAAADLMLGRSGAGTVIETALVGLPTILVPLPHGNGEQARNAEPLVRAGGAVLIPDADLDATRLLAEALSLFGDPPRLAAMSAVGRTVFPADAAERLARLVLSAARGGRNAA